MAETLLTLIKEIVKENRNFTLEEENKYKKLKLLNNQLYNEFKIGIKKKLFMPLFKFYIKDKVLFDSDEYDYIIINVGLKFLKSILVKLLYIDLNKSQVIDAQFIDRDIDIYFQDLYLDFDVIIFFEISDKKARIAIIKKEITNKLRKTCKVYTDFPFENMSVIYTLEDLK